MTYEKLLRYDKPYAPIQITHDFEFVALNLGNGYTEIRNFDRDGKVAYIKGRIDKLFSRGYGGVAINVDFKDYLRDDEALEIFYEAAKYAKSLGMRVWVYDEQYYPTGGAGSLSLVDHPECEALGLAELTAEFESDGRIPLRIASPYGHSELKYALYAPMGEDGADLSAITLAEGCRDLSGGLTLYLPKGKYTVWCYFFRAQYEHTYMCQGLRASRRYINVFDTRAVDRFLEVTYEKGYFRGGAERFSDVVDAIFTDEPHFPPYVEYKGQKGTRFVSYADFEPSIEGVKAYPHVPWVIDLPEKFCAEYGYDIITALPHLFRQTPSSRKTRRDFYYLLSRLCKEAFVENYRAYLEKYGVALSGHYYTEETFDFHPICFGDILDQLGAMDVPGCDKLTSAPDELAHCIASKLASSAAHLFGKDEVMIEASNMMGEDQNMDLRDLKVAAELMFVNGVNVITSYYGEDMLSPEEMTEYARFVSDLSSICHGGKYRADTLLYYPFELYAENTEPFGGGGDFIQSTDTLGVAKSGKILMENQIRYDIINRKGLLDSKLGENYIEAPSGERITAIVFPNVDRLDPEVAAFVERAHERGIAVIHNGNGRIDGLSFTAERLDTYRFLSDEARLSEYNAGITLCERSFDGYDLFHLVNFKKEEAKVSFTVKDEGCSYAEIDVNGQAVLPMAVTRVGNKARIDLTLPALSGKIIMRSKEA